MLWRMGFGSQIYFPETRIAADLHLERVEINKKSLRVNAPTAGLAGTFRAKRKESGSYAHRRNWAAQEHVATLLYRRAYAESMVNQIAEHPASESYEAGIL